MHLLLIPIWFYGFDTLMYFVSAIVGFFISSKSYKLYSVTRKKPHLYLHLGFMLLSLGLFLSGFVSTYSYVMYKSCIRNCSLSLFDTIFGVEDFGLFLYFGLSILGYSILALAHLPEKTKISSFVLLFILAFSVVMMLVSAPRSELLMWYTYHQYFNLLSVLIVGYILFKVLINFSESRNLVSFLVVLGFSGIFVFHTLHFFSFFNPWMYVFAHLFLITGYLSLLAMLIKVRR